MELIKVRLIECCRRSTEPQNFHAYMFDQKRSEMTNTGAHVVSDLLTNVDPDMVIPSTTHHLTQRQCEALWLAQQAFVQRGHIAPAIRQELLNVRRQNNPSRCGFEVIQKTQLTKFWGGMQLEQSLDTVLASFGAAVVECDNKWYVCLL